jgi:TrmH family RNA methyltransferase
MITSTDNPKVKQARLLLERRGRTEAGRCLAEGVRLIEDAMRVGVFPTLVFFVAPALEQPRAAALLKAARDTGSAPLELSPAVFDTLSDTVTSQGIIAVLPIPQPVLPLDPTLILVLDQMRDPGNLGAILRSAAAAGVDALLLTKGCTDPWSPKVLRAGMGAHFRLALAADLSWQDIARVVGARPIWLADAQADVAYDQIDWTQPCALVIGGEASGLSDQAQQSGTERIAIPMSGHTESLNAAMAATVLLFEAVRQRRRMPKQIA